MNKFGTILTLLDSKDSTPSTKFPEFAEKTIFVYDNKDRKIDTLSFYSGYSITENAKNSLLNFCNTYNKERITFFIIKLTLNSIIIYDQNKKFLLNLERAT